MNKSKNIMKNRKQINKMFKTTLQIIGSNTVNRQWLQLTFGWQLEVTSFSKITKLRYNALQECKTKIFAKTEPSPRIRFHIMSTYGGQTDGRERKIYSPQVNKRYDNQNKLMWQAAREEIPI